MVDLLETLFGSEFVENIKSFFSGEATGIRFLDITLFGEVTIGNLLALLIIAIITIILIKLTGSIIRRKLSGKVDAKNADGVIKLVSWIIFFIALLIASPQLHLDLSALMVTGGVVGVAIAFASQTTLSNFIAGILLMIERPIGAGDIVIINNTEGTVESISLLSTYIKTYDGIILRIPNTNVFSSEIRNCVSNIARRFSYTIDIRYSDNADTAVAIIRNTISKHPFALIEPAPSLYVDDLGAHGIKIVVKIWAPSVYWWTARTELLWQIFKDLRNGGIDVPFNQLTLWYGKDDAEKLQENLDNDKSAAEILGIREEPK